MGADLAKQATKKALGSLGLNFRRLFATEALEQANQAWTNVDEKIGNAEKS